MESFPWLGNKTCPDGKTNVGRNLNLGTDVDTPVGDADYQVPFR
jgi:hypothetical protein